MDVACTGMALWDNGRACGRGYHIKCIGTTNLAPQPCRINGAAIVEIVDYCPKSNSTLKLSLDAFSKLADLSSGKVKIKFKQ
ncbi:Expansin, partial [Trema orientale]